MLSSFPFFSKPQPGITTESTPHPSLIQPTLREPETSSHTSHHTHIHPTISCKSDIVPQHFNIQQYFTITRSHLNHPVSKKQVFSPTPPNTNHQHCKYIYFYFLPPNFLAYIFKINIKNIKIPHKNKHKSTNKDKKPPHPQKKHTKPNKKGK